MNHFPLHLAPNAPWVLLLGASVALGALSVWAYGFAAPPLRPGTRRALVALRFTAAVLLLWLLAQPVLERTRGADARIAVLIDRSASMGLPVRPGGETRAAAAARVLESLRRSMRGRAAIDVLPFAATLGTDTTAVHVPAGATALGDALDQLGRSVLGQRATAAVVVSDGVVNAGADPVGAAEALGLPVHAVVVGEGGGVDRAIAGLEAPPDARAGQREPVRVRISSSEPRGAAIPVRLFEGAHEMARGTALAPGAGAEATLELSATPNQPGLAVWTARVDTLRGEITTVNNARSVALEVAPGRIGVRILSAGLNWDLTFVRRALMGDSSLDVSAWTLEQGRWHVLGGRSAPGRAGRAPVPSDLRGQAVVVLDGLASADLGAPLDRALAEFTRAGGGLLVLGGPPPGLPRYRGGALGAVLGVRLAPSPSPRTSAPAPTAEATDLAAWDDDPTRGQQAWRDAAPLRDVAPLAPAAGDRVLIASSGGGPPLLVGRRIGRGQALLVNGSGVWRWSLSPTDDLAGERGRRLWRRLARWLAEPVQGEPLRVRPEHWITSSGESVRLFATLQDSAFRPLAGARIEGEVTLPVGASRAIKFDPQEAGSYTTALDGLAPGRYRVTVHARVEGAHARDAGSASSEFVVDRWSLEEAKGEPDSATLRAVAGASGGTFLGAAEVERSAGRLPIGALTRGRMETVRLWESPWVFAFVVGALAVEWGWRRRRGLP